MISASLELEYLTGGTPFASNPTPVRMTVQT